MRECPDNGKRCEIIAESPDTTRRVRTAPHSDEAADAVASRSGVVPDAMGGSRFDQVLVELFPEFSRSRLASWIRSGRALLDGAEVKPRHRVIGGERVDLQPIAELSTQVVAEAIALEVVLDDPAFLIIDKPAGLIVHPGAGNPSRTLQNALLHFDASLAGIPRAGIVHRLDKDTSGLLVVARTLAAHNSLVTQLGARSVKRQYLALVIGTPVAGGTVNEPIDRDPRERLRMAVREDGRPAVTHYRIRERFRAHTLLEVNLETGRTHQIRVHLAHRKLPLVGDPLYGPGLRLPKGASDELVEQLRGFRRQALHAEVLEFVHPESSGPVHAESALPADFATLLAALRRDQREAPRAAR